MTNLAHKTPAEAPYDKPGDSVVEIVRIPQITLHAFCDTPDIISVVESVAADRRMARAHVSVHRGGIAAATELYRHAASPNLVIIESRAAAADLHAALDALADVCVSGTKMIVIGYANDVALYRELMGRGVSEYIVAPIDAIALIAVISRLYRAAGTKKLGRTLAFIGATGGAGSSTIAHNAASAIAQAKAGDVILADLDLPFGSASLGFKLNPTQSIAQALEDASRLDEVLLERMLTKCGDHLSVLTAPATLDNAYDLAEGAFERVLDIAQTNVPFVVLDMPHVWTSWAKKTLLAADEVVITAVPDLASLRNAKNLVDLLRLARPNDAPPRLVLNQIGVPKRSEIKADKFADALKIEPIACIQFDPATVSTAANEGRMIVDRSAKSAVSRHFAEIARIITGRARTKPSRKSWFALTRP